MIFWRWFVRQSFYMSSTLSKTLPFHCMSTNLSMSYLVHHVSIQSLIPSIVVDLIFSHEIILVSLYLSSLVINFLNLLFPTICKSSITICRWSLSIKQEPYSCMAKLSWRKDLTSRLEKKLLKLNILGLIWFLSEYARVYYQIWY